MRDLSSVLTVIVCSSIAQAPIALALVLQIGAAASALAGSAPKTPIVEWSFRSRTTTTDRDQELLSRYCRTGTVTSTATVEYADHFDDSRRTAHMMTVSDLRIADLNGSESLVTMHFFMDPRTSKLLVISSDVNEHWVEAPPRDRPRKPPVERLPEGMRIHPLEAELASTVEEVLGFAANQFGMRWDVGQLVVRPRSIANPYAARYPDPEPTWLVQSDGCRYPMSVGYSTGRIAWLPDEDFSRSVAASY